MKFVILCLIVSTILSFILSKHNGISSGSKIIAVVFFVLFSLASYDSLRKVSGYPSVSELPLEAEIVWGRVVEAEEKYIEVWVLFERSYEDKIFSFYHKENPISRVYRMKYTKKRHRAMLQILEAIKNGEKQGIKRKVSKSALDSFEQSVKRYNVESKRMMIKKQKNF